MERKKLRKADYSVRESRGKRGQIQGLMVVGIMMTIMVIIILVGYKVLSEVNTAFSNNDQIPTQGKEALSSFESRYDNIFDAIFILFIVLSAVMMVVSVLFIDSHPIFFAILLPAFIAVLIVNAMLINAVDDFGTSGPIVDLYQELEMTRFAASHWVAIMSVVGGVTLMAFLGKRVGE